VTDAVQNTSRNGRHHHDWPRWSGVMITVVIAILAFTVQWGVVTTKLDHVERRLDELIFESRSLRNEYQNVERRLSFLEGRGYYHSGPPTSGGGGGEGRE